MDYTPPPGSIDPNAPYVTGKPGVQRGSPVPAEAVEHPQREIVNVIREAGLDPSKDDLTQLWQAIRKIFAGAGMRRGGIAAYYKVTFGGSDGRRPIFWGETEADENYVLCDGGSDGAGGTVPDLRGRMIMGASDARPAGTTGGSETHEHSLSGTVGAATLSVGQLAAHGHAIILTTTGQNGTVGVYGLSASTEAGRSSSRIITTGNSQPHTHSLTASTQPASNMPPYYALAYIMRCA